MESRLSRLYVSTPIYYVNGDPHIGHAHTSIMADILKRAALMRGKECLLSTGTDEHGQKNQTAAEASGLSPQAYQDRQSALFRDLFDRLNVSYDVFARTSDPFHMEQVQEIERRLHAAGLLVQKPYRGLYCVGCEQFKKASDLDEQGRCVDHLVPPEEMDEVNYFMRIEPFRPWLIEHIENNPGWIQPNGFRNEVMGMLRQPLEDLCISRPRARVALGVPLPFDPDYVTYVWFDALINYVTNIGWPDERHAYWWPYSENLIGKDIVKTHCIYWPIMLRALGLTPPNRLSVHGYWIAAGGQKMSKSLGNAVDPVDIINLLGADALRFYLAKNMRTGSDSQIGASLIVSTYNTDLANKIGNLLSRVVKFTARHFDGKVPEGFSLSDEDHGLVEGIARTAAREHGAVTLHTIPSLVQEAVVIAETLNIYIDTTAPWTHIKNPDNRNRVGGVLYVLLDGLRLLFEMLSPVIPATAARGLIAIGADPIPLEARLHEFVPMRLSPGTPLGDDVNLFPRVQE